MRRTTGVLLDGGFAQLDSGPGCRVGAAFRSQRQGRNLKPLAASPSYELVGATDDGMVPQIAEQTGVAERNG